MDRVAVERLTPAVVRLDGLTVVRFFAALWVFAFHFDARRPIEVAWHASKLIEQGALAMPVFFMLSGMVLAYRGFDGLGPFFRARIGRIYPAYALAVLLCLPFMPWTTTALFALPVDALLLQAWYPNLFGYWHHGGTWSISVEFFLYAAFPLLVGLRGLSTRGILLACAGCFLLAGSWIPSMHLAGSSRLPFPVFYSVPMFHLPEFAVGVMLAELHRRGFRGHGAAPLALLLVVATLKPWNEGFAGLNVLTLPLVALSLLYAARVDFRQQGTRLVFNRTTIYLGDISYGLFVYQMPLMMWLGHHPNAIPTPVLFVGMLAVNLALAAASHRWFEPWARRLVSRSPKR